MPIIDSDGPRYAGDAVLPDGLQAPHAASSGLVRASTKQKSPAAVSEPGSFRGWDGLVQAIPASTASTADS
jgi:hypothetical protein